MVAGPCKCIELAGSEAALQAQLQTAESRHEGASAASNGARKQTKVSVLALESLSISFNAFHFVASRFFLRNCLGMTGVVPGRESADADAQTTPEGEAEQLAIAAALKAGVTKNCCRTRNASNIFKPFQDESVLPFVHLTFALHHSCPLAICSERFEGL